MKGYPQLLVVILANSFYQLEYFVFQVIKTQLLWLNKMIYMSHYKKYGGKVTQGW